MPAATTWQLLCVDDDPEFCRQVQEYLEGERITGTDDRLQVETLNDFGRALDALDRRRFDLVILDVRLGSHRGTPDEEAGATTLQAIRERRFVPVVFYTGLPHLVQDLTNPLVQVVEKTAGLPRLLDSLKNILATRLPAVNRALIRHLETIQRDYMWDFVANHWEQLSDTPDHTSLAYLLARRLATSLSLDRGSSNWRKNWVMSLALPWLKASCILHNGFGHDPSFPTQHPRVAQPSDPILSSAAYPGYAGSLSRQASTPIRGNGCA